MKIMYSWIVAFNIGNIGLVPARWKNIRLIKINSLRQVNKTVIYERYNILFVILTLQNIEKEIISIEKNCSEKILTHALQIENLKFRKMLILKTFSMACSC